jgi:hypothetical protein
MRIAGKCRTAFFDFSKKRRVDGGQIDHFFYSLQFAAILYLFLLSH